MKFRELSDKKLNEKISELRSEITDAKFELNSQNLDVLNDYRAKKTQLAQAMTVRKERALGIEVSTKEVEAPKPKKKDTEEKAKETKKKTDTKSKKD